MLDENLAWTYKIGKTMLTRSKYVKTCVASFSNTLFYNQIHFWFQPQVAKIWSKFYFHKNTDPVKECATLLRKQWKQCEDLDFLFLFLIIVIINLFSVDFEIAAILQKIWF